MKNVRTILQALKDTRLYCNPKKSKLFCMEINFLGHHISLQGIEADKSKIEHILDWPIPESATQVRGFLGLVCYISAFLLKLADFTRVLTELMFNECDKKFLAWLPHHQNAFDSIKKLVTSPECLTTIDYSKMPSYKIFVTTDASDLRSGAVLSFGETWETACPVAFDSMTFKGAELNYPVHEKELLAIICALKQWQSDLIGASFLIYTDHKTLENFQHQKDLSHRQARWMEFLSQYDGRIVYVKGEDNCVADALSHIPMDQVISASSSAGAGDQAFPLFHDIHCSGKIASILTTSNRGPIAAAANLVAAPPAFHETVLSISADHALLEEIKSGYKSDPFINSLQAASTGMSSVSHREGFWFIGDRLVIPNITRVREALFQLAHDSLGHFGKDKSYAALRHSYYWPNMRKQLELFYVPSCMECQ